jgi:MFS family permease
LRLYNYRVWFIGALISNIGQWMQSTAQSWVVLTVLTDGDATAMGVTLALQFAPPLVLVGVTGWVADRFDRRIILFITQASLGLVSIAIGTLLITGVMTLPLMLCFAALTGVVTAFDNPSRQAFVSDLVAKEHAANAIALNAAGFNGARLIGPAVAGLVVVAIGGGWVFIVNAASFAATILALVLIRVRELSPRARADRSARLADGFRYVARRPDLAVLFVIVFVIGAFGMNFPIYASTMALEFGLNADGFGLLTSMFAVGSLAGALLAARRARARLRVVVIAALGFGVTSLVSAFMPVYAAYAAVIVVVGLFLVTLLTTANGYVQTTTEPALRGRVMALYIAVLMGGTPIGAPIVGWVAQVWGPRAAILVAAAAGIAGAAIGVGWFLVSGRVHRSPEARLGFQVASTRSIQVQAEPEEFSDQVAESTPLRDLDEDDD